MRIIEVELVKNKRLMLNNIDKIIYTPESDFQIILGTNGSGKSTLLRELSPLPAQSSDYLSGGSKTIKLQSNSKNYCLVSDFKSGSGRHSFFVDDGENLNPGGTASVQRELVKQYFQFDQDIHAILTGNLTFTSMTPTLRRQWITRLSSTDLTYATQKFNELKVMNRDSAGVLKHINNRISLETNKLLTLENVENLEMQSKILKEELTILMEGKEPGLPGVWETEQNLTTALQTLENLSRQVLDIDLTPPAGIELHASDSISDVENVLSDVRQQLNFNEGMLAHLVTEYSDLDSILTTLQNNGAEGIEELNQRIEDLQHQEAVLTDSIEMFLVENDPEAVRQDSRDVIDNLLLIFNNLPINTEKKFNRDRYAEAKTRVDDIRHTVNKNLNRINQLENRIEHSHNAKDTACPKCNYVWKPGVSENEISECKEMVQRLTEANEALLAEIASLEVEIDQTEDYIASLRRYRNITQDYTRLNLLWDHIASSNLISEDPKSITPILYTWLRDVSTSCSLFLVKKDLASLIDAVEHANKLNTAGSGHFNDRVKVLQDNIQSTTTKVELYNQQVKRLTKYKDVLAKMYEYKGEISRQIQKVYEAQETLVKLSRDKIITDVINRHQSTLAHVLSALNEKNTLEGIVKDLKESGDRIALDKEAYQMIVDALSPTEGIIAEQLMGAILSITNSINSVIAAVWTYELTVQPCGTADGELDYKFPMIRGDGHDIEDISCGSTAMVSIINFAFVCLVYSHLNLQDYPLWLDELGKDFDEQHRINVMNYIKTCMDSKIFSQVFFVSHFASQHGSFNTAEVLVLDGTNISTPMNHNQHVKFS